MLTIQMRAARQPWRTSTINNNRGSDSKANIKLTRGKNRKAL